MEIPQQKRKKTELRRDGPGYESHLYYIPAV